VRRATHAPLRHALFWRAPFWRAPFWRDPDHLLDPALPSLSPADRTLK